MSRKNRTTRGRAYTARLAHVIGACLLLAGATVAGYMAWALWLSGLSTANAQEELRRRWAHDTDAPPAAPHTAGTADAATAREPASPALDRRASPVPPPKRHVKPGDPYAVVWFSRPGAATAPVRAGPLYVVEGVGRDHLRAGPGHYPHSDAPGDPGNFAVAGHRTTHGAPFGDLDELKAGDLIRVADHHGRRWTYEVVKQRIVDPGDAWVLGDDPLGSGTGTMTLTTCHPRWSATQRLIVFATLTPTPPR